MKNVKQCDAVNPWPFRAVGSSLRQGLRRTGQLNSLVQPCVTEGFKRFTLDLKPSLRSKELWRALLLRSIARGLPSEALAVGWWDWRDSNLRPRD